MTDKNDRPYLQLNFKVGDTLVNLYADDVSEFDEGLEVLTARAGQLAELTALAQSAAEAAGILRSPLAQRPPAATPQGPKAPAQGGPAGDSAPGPQCEHGPRIFKTGTSAKTGRSWRAWDCPSNICARQWA